MANGCFSKQLKYFFVLRVMWKASKAEGKDEGLEKRREGGPQTNFVQGPPSTA